MNSNKLAETLTADFNRTLETNWEPPNELRMALERLTGHFTRRGLKTFASRKRSLIASINRKFRFNSEAFRLLLDTAAENRIFFNYHDKMRLLDFLNFDSRNDFRNWLKNKSLDIGVEKILDAAFSPITGKETRRRLYQEIEVSGKKEDIFQALFGAYIFRCYDEKEMHQYFNPDCRRGQVYYECFYDHLKAFYADVLKREPSLIYLVVDERLRNSLHNGTSFRDAILTFIKTAHERLANHCYFAILIKPMVQRSKDTQWELCSDIILFAEKYDEVYLKKGYFNAEKIATQTRQHIPNIDENKARFDLANEGFFYKDCFILAPVEASREVPGETHSPYSLLILFQKNQRDETRIPCPACRCLNVQGNSYPVFGVRSWECRNPFCPDRSKFNRGKRYQVASLIKQEAIEREENLIPIESLRKWRLDVVAISDEQKIEDMLIRHYTLHGDTVIFINSSTSAREIEGRRVIREMFARNNYETGIRKRFFSSAFFHRFRIEKVAKKRKKELFPNISDVDGVEIYHGDSYEVLQALPENSFDGAVTSPPYYNARSYSQWSNIYCYLYDMLNIQMQVYRVLKPGSIFLFNIFDYFDNENNIVFSAMGKKRMILGAYMIHLFQACGFRVCRNIMWHKGEIEGKRSFNQGNMSPYYQAPHNCWEHVLVFSKGPPRKEIEKWPYILYAKPVIKMVKGKNRLGHSAPFPPEIPKLLLNRLGDDSVVLDPFSGSMTTGRTAYRHGVKSVNVDRNMEYCKLGLKLLRNESNQLTLFELS